MCFVLQCFGPIQVPRWGQSRPVLVPSCSRAFLTGSAWTGRNRLLGHFRFLSFVVSTKLIPPTAKLGQQCFLGRRQDFPAPSDSLLTLRSRSKQGWVLERVGSALFLGFSGSSPGPFQRFSFEVVLNKKRLMTHDERESQTARKGTNRQNLSRAY